MYLDGVCGDEKRLGDIAVGIAGGGEFGNPTFAGGKCVWSPRGDFREPNAVGSKFGFPAFDERRSAADVRKLDAAVQILMRLVVLARASKCSADVNERLGILRGSQGGDMIAMNLAADIPSTAWHSCSKRASPTPVSTARGIPPDIESTSITSVAARKAASATVM